MDDPYPRDFVGYGRTTPDLGALSTHNTQLEQTRERLEVMPPTQPIHWQVKRLQALSKVLPEISAFQAVEADPNNYSEAIAQRIGNFGGVVWKVAMKGSFLSLTMLCRIAQARIPLLIDSVRAENGQAHVVLFVLGAPATA